MNFNDLCTAEAHENGAEMQVKDPITYELTDFYIMLQGRDSKAFRFKNKSNQIDALTRIQNKDVPSDDELDSMDIDTLVECTTGWKNLFDGENEIVFSKEKARELYTASPAVREQAEKFITRRENFTKG